jgi:hypothetical protein
MHTFVKGILLLVILQTGSCKERKENTSITNSNSTDSNVVVEPQFYPITGPIDAIYRNRVITRNYYFGAEILNQSLSNGKTSRPFQANWLHFGIWGSMRAGETMNGVDIQGVLTTKDFVFDYLEQSLAWLPLGMHNQFVENIRKDRALIDTTHKIISTSLASGNQRVAEEIMGITDRYVRMLGCEKSLDQSRLDAFLDTFEYQHDRSVAFKDLWQSLLTKIPSLTKGAIHRFGQDSLARAFEAYHRSRFQTDELIRAQMMHYGNLMIAIHEQFVLQTYISGAIGILDPASSVYRHLITILAMDLGLPDNNFRGVSQFGQGLRRYPLRQTLPAREFSPQLTHYQWGPLVELAKVTGLDVNSGRGASDWQDYRSRIYFIGGIMRTMQSRRLVASFPFSGPHPRATLSCGQQAPGPLRDE